MINCLSQQRLSSLLFTSVLVPLFLLTPLTVSANDDNSNELSEEIRNAVVRQLSQQEGNIPTSSTDEVQADSEDKELVEDQAEDSPDNADTTDSAKNAVASTDDKESPSPETNSTTSTEEKKDSTIVEKQPATPKKRSRKTRNKLTQEERYTANYIMRSARNNPRPKQSKTSGWIYLGAYKQQEKTWEKKMLNVKNTLPRVGSTYALKYALNMRETYPIKDSTSKLLKSLKKDSGVKILNVHPSGKNGHYWALVEPIQGARRPSR